MPVVCVAIALLEKLFGLLLIDVAKHLCKSVALALANLTLSSELAWLQAKMLSV
jgi:hypothetical protein